MMQARPAAGAAGATGAAPQQQHSFDAELAAMDAGGVGDAWCRFLRLHAHCLHPLHVCTRTIRRSVARLQLHLWPLCFGGEPITCCGSSAAAAAAARGAREHYTRQPRALRWPLTTCLPCANSTPELAAMDDEIAAIGGASPRAPPGRSPSRSPARRGAAGTPPGSPGAAAAAARRPAPGSPARGGAGSPPSPRRGPGAAAGGTQHAAAGRATPGSPTKLGPVAAAAAARMEAAAAREAARAAAAAAKEAKKAADAAERERRRRELQEKLAPLRAPQQHGQRSRSASPQRARGASPQRPPRRGGGGRAASPQPGCLPWLSGLWPWGHAGQRQRDQQGPGRGRQGGREDPEAALEEEIRRARAGAGLDEEMARFDAGGQPLAHWARLGPGRGTCRARPRAGRGRLWQRDGALRRR